MSGWAAAASAVTDLLSSAVSSILSYKQQKKLMKYNYDLQRQSRQTAFGDTKQSLLRAGYNPILALGQQSNAITPSSSAQSVDFGNPVDSGINAYSALSSVQNDNQRVENENVQTANDTARAENESLESMQRQALTKAQVENQLIKNEVDKATAMDTAIASLENLKDNSALTKQQVRNLQHDIKVGSSTIIRNIAEAGQASSAAQYARLQSKAEKDYQDWLEDKNSDSKGENKRPKRGIKYTGYTSRAMGFNPVQAGIQGLVGGVMMKGRR